VDVRVRERVKFRGHLYKYTTVCVDVWSSWPVVEFDVSERVKLLGYRVYSNLMKK
jgi:hypothetical protein